MTSLAPANTRKPCVSGMFYPSDKNKLSSDIKKALDDAKTSETNSNIKLVAGIVPHAGYFYSAKCAASIIKQIPKHTKIVIILGFSHSGFDSHISTSLQTWLTPLGSIEPEKKIIKELIGCKIATQNNMSIDNEHSIEVQIPFINYLINNKTIDNNAKIIPLSIPNKDTTEFAEDAKKIINVLRKHNLLENTLFLASSDFIHYGSRFNYTPFDDKDDTNFISTKKKIKELDNKAIELITNNDSDGLLNLIKQTNATICGINPILLLIEIIKLLDTKDSSLLDYYQSSDIVKNKSGDNNSVSYASIGFYK